MKKIYIHTFLLIFSFHNIFFASYETKKPLKVSTVNSFSDDDEFENINAFEKKSVEKSIIDADFIKIIMQYYKIIQSWQISYWYLPGFRAYDMQKLVTAINNDIHTHTISVNQLNFILDILIKQIDNIEIKNVLEITKSRFQSSSTTNKSQLLKKIHEAVFKISQPQYENQSKIIIPTVGQIETVDQYLLQEKNKDLQKNNRK